LKIKKWISFSLLFIISASLLMAFVNSQEDTRRYDLIIVRNDDLIDYIVAIPYASKLGIPIVPVNPTQLDEKARAQLYSYVQFGWKNVLIIGNYDAVSKEVEDELLGMGFTPTRIGGDVRTETAEKLALHFYSKADTVVLASALDYGSALAAARFSMTYDYPLLLTLENDLSEYAATALETLKPKQVVMIGTGLSPVIESKLESLGYSVFWYGKNIQRIPIEPPKKPSPYKYSLIGAVISLAIAVPIVIYYGKKRWSANRVPIEVLTEKERIVVKAILQKGGQVKQEDLPELTGYSRPTVSRIIQELEKKQLVSREKIGKTFIVKMIKEINLKE